MPENRIRISERVYLNPISNELIFLTKSGENKVRIESGMAQLLQHLAQTAGAVVSPQQLIKPLSGLNERKQSQSLTRNIQKLRKVFRKHGWKHAIEIIPNKGYRLNTSSCKLRKPFPTKAVMLIAAAVIIFILINMAFPGMSDTLQSGITHK
jgi:DNA-binding winged helix-turn-helix (wHTH) protein